MLSLPHRSPKTRRKKSLREKRRWLSYPAAWKISAILAIWTRFCKVLRYVARCFTRFSYTYAIFLVALLPCMKFIFADDPRDQRWPAAIKPSWSRDRCKQKDGYGSEKCLRNAWQPSSNSWRAASAIFHVASKCFELCGPVAKKFLDFECCMTVLYCSTLLF